MATEDDQARSPRGHNTYISGCSSVKKFVAAASIAVILPFAGTVSAATAPTANGAEERDPIRTVQITDSGLVIQRVSHGDVTVTTYGTSAPRIDLGTDPIAAEDSDGAPGEDSVTVEFPEADGDQGASSTKSIPPTIYEMTLASGNFSPSEACDFAKGMDGYGCRTSAEVAQDRSLTGTESQMASASVYDSRCFDFRTTSGDGEKLSHNCNVRYLDSKTKLYVYIANKMKSTGWENNTGWNADGISGVGIQARYKHSAATAVDWDPTRTTYSNCRQRTVTVQGRRGASYSSSATICDDVLEAWHSPAYQYFGSKWKGPEAPRGHERSTIAASLTRIPRGGTRAYSIHAWLHWN